MSILPLPGDLVRDRNPGAPTHRVFKVVEGVCHLDNGRMIPANMAVLVKRGPAHGIALEKAREGDGRYTDRKFKTGDPVKVTGPVPNKGKTGKVAMVAGNGHVVTHEDGSHMIYDEKHLSHDCGGDEGAMQ